MTHVADIDLVAATRLRAIRCKYGEELSDAAAAGIFLEFFLNATRHVHEAGCAR